MLKTRPFISLLSTVLSLNFLSQKISFYSRRKPVTTMAGALAAAARQAGTLSRFSSPSLSANQASKLIQRRGLSGGGDHHGTPKVNVWSDPMSPSKWKEEHFVIVSLTGWGVLIFGGYKFFSGGKKEEKAVVKPL